MMTLFFFFFISILLFFVSVGPKFIAIVALCSVCYLGNLAKDCHIRALYKSLNGYVGLKFVCVNVMCVVCHVSNTLTVCQISERYI